MKKILILPILMLVLLVVACNSNSNKNSQSGVAFNPQTPQSQILDENREAAIATKKAQYVELKSYEDMVATAYQFEGKIKLTTFIPNDDNLTPTESRLLETKMLQMVTANGIGGLGGNPRFIIAPVVTELQRDVMSKSPIRYLVKYDITFYVADLLTGTLFGTYNMQKSGVGESPTRAFVSLFKDINPLEPEIQQFLESSQNKIIEFYKVHGGEMINEAKMLAAQEKYGEALTLLSSIPVEATDHYATATKLAEEIFSKHVENNCTIYLAKMKAALGRTIGDSGFNEEAMCYYSLINKGSCKGEADQVYKEYKQEVFQNQERKRKYEVEDREWAAKVAQQDADNEYRMFKTQLAADIQMSGNTCLLEKYKRDGFNNLSFFSKIFNLGQLFEERQCGNLSATEAKL